jgi:MinD-like ATPase involved in chromosome partitioning or flagellar assembly
MILLLNIFSSIKEKLRDLKKEKKIDKYYIGINQTNTIDVVIVSETELNRKDISDAEFTFTLITKEDLEEDLYYDNLFKTENEIVSYEDTRRKLSNLLDFNDKTNYVPPCPVITFYSYKGGMGRSTNLVVQATHLARHHKQKVIIIDCDFEAPGFSNFFLEVPASPKYSNGLVEYFLDSEVDDYINLNMYSWEVSKNFSNDGEIRIIPAGNLSEDSIDNVLFDTHRSQYLEGLSRIDFSSTEYILNKFKRLIDEINKQYKPDIIFIDSRTGFTDILGLTALKLSSHVVGLFGNSVQNLPGLNHYLDLLIKNKKEDFRGLIINAFSDSDMFDEFKNRINSFILEKSQNEEDFLLSIESFYFRYNTFLAQIGTTQEKAKDFVEQIDDKSFGKGYTDVANRLYEFINEFQSDKTSIFEPCSLSIKTISPTEQNDDFPRTQQRILSALNEEWPDLYGENIDFNKEYNQNKYFFRNCMKDILNFDKFLVLGSKGTGKSYIFQSLKDKDVVEFLKKKAQKTQLTIDFLHLVDKKENFFISTTGFKSFLTEKMDVSDFYSKFWKVYTWSAIITKLDKELDFTSELDILPIINNDTATLKEYFNFVHDVENIIKVEQELLKLDKLLNSKQIDLIAIYDNLDLMVEPLDWKDEIAPLINFWRYTNFKRIHPKLFLRTDLYKKIYGLNNSIDLENRTIKIEWTKEEIFNYFFKLVNLYAKEDFERIVLEFNFKEPNGDKEDGWVKDFLRRSKNTSKQVDLGDFVLRRLCWVFFGKYPDRKNHGESYDWLYKNVMNADETISLRPFIDLLSLAIQKFIADKNRDSSALLPKTYYTASDVRNKAVQRHFEDLVKEKGNENLQKIFEFIDDNREFQYYEFMQEDFNNLLENVIIHYGLNVSKKELEDLLIINGIVRKTPVPNNRKFTFAFLYKYRLGLGNRKKNRD